MTLWTSAAIGRLERKKYNQVVSTYSDVYTGILITAPLLFIVVLTIVNNFGGGFAGLSVESIAMIGTYALIPFLNILFIPTYGIFAAAWITVFTEMIDCGMMIFFLKKKINLNPKT